MPLRVDEQICFNAFDGFLRDRYGDAYEFVECPDPPDANLSIGSCQFDVEITNVFRRHDTDTGEQLPDPGLAALIQRLAATATTRLGDDLSGIYVFHPLRPFDSMRTSFDEIVDGICEFATRTRQDARLGYETFTTTAGQRWSIRKLERSSNLIGTSYSPGGGFLPEVLSDFIDCVNCAVTAKANNETLMNTNNPVVLLLLDRHMLTPHEHFPAVGQDLSDSAAFHSVYLVSQNCVTLLHGENLDSRQG